MGELPRVDIYARVSRLGDDRQRSTDGQTADCRARAEEYGAEVDQVHVDAGRSAWNPRIRRPAWDNLMSRLESGATGGVVVFDLARFSRRPPDGERLIAAADRGMVVLDSESGYDLTTANGRKQFRDQINTAAYESDRLSTRVARGKRVKAQSGKSNHSYRPFGFESNGVTPREDEAMIIREVTDRLLDSESMDSVVNDLNSRGLTTTTGGPWRKTQLRQFLLRPRNAGRVVYRGEVVSQLPSEPLVDPDKFDRLRSLFDSRRRGRPATDAYLASGVAQCGSCKNTLCGKPRRRRDGSIRRVYWCMPPRGCNGTSVVQEPLDEYLRSFVIEIMSDPRHTAAIEEANRKSADERQKLDSEIAENERLAEELSGRLGRGEISISRYDAAVKPLDSRLAELRKRRAEVQEGSSPVVGTVASEATKQEWAERWDNATTSERRSLLLQALRGRTLKILPRDKNARPRFDPARVKIE